MCADHIGRAAWREYRESCGAARYASNFADAVRVKLTATEIILWERRRFFAVSERVPKRIDDAEPPSVFVRRRGRQIAFAPQGDQHHGGILKGRRRESLAAAISATLRKDPYFLRNPALIDAVFLRNGFLSRQIGCILLCRDSGGVGCSS